MCHNYFSTDLKNLPNHKSGIMLSQNRSLCKKKKKITKLLFYLGNCTRSGQVQCPGGKCIPTSYLCDGANDCRDKSQSDEQGCR